MVLARRRRRAVIGVLVDAVVTVCNRTQQAEWRGRVANMTGVRLTILGTAGSYPGPGRACSSYLLEAEGFRLLMDCGHGAMSNLSRVCDSADVDALFLSHAHPDHWADAVALHCARRWHRDGPQILPVLGPPGLGDFIGRIMSDPQDWAWLFPFTSVSPGERVDVGPFELRLHAASHPVETLAARVSHSDVVVAYSSDSGPCDAMTEVAKDATVFLADCTWPTSAGPYPPDMHMTGAQAGEAAARGGAALLLVTHVLPVYDPQELAEEAATTFDGEVGIATDLQVLDL
jgi:ribonuclease BN (tRNA processing enzyme)